MIHSRSWLKRGDLARERRLETHRLRNQPSNAAGLCPVAGSPDNTLGLSKGHQRACKSEVAPVGQKGVQCHSIRSVCGRESTRQ